jgi:hypothetical protein
MEASMVEKGLNPATTPITSMMNYMTSVAEPSEEEEEESGGDEPPDWVQEDDDG